MKILLACEKTGLPHPPGINRGTCLDCGTIRKLRSITLNPEKYKISQKNAYDRKKGTLPLWAMGKVHMAERAGRLPDPRTLQCVDCAAEGKVRMAEAHDHRKYLEPLNVDPVCRSHNRLRKEGEYRDYESKIAQLLFAEKYGNNWMEIADLKSISIELEFLEVVTNAPDPTIYLRRRILKRKKEK